MNGFGFRINGNRASTTPASMTSYEIIHSKIPPPPTQDEVDFQEAEKKLFSDYINGFMHHRLIPIPLDFVREKQFTNPQQRALFINTVFTDDSDANKEVLVLLHGWSAGIGAFINNYDELSKRYRIYALDLLGFGRSSRPNVDEYFKPAKSLVEKAKRKETEAFMAQQFWVESLEAWVNSMRTLGYLNVDNFVLAGHSLSGYISTLYTNKYPHRVSKLILLAPIGFKRFAIPPFLPFSSFWAKSLWSAPPQQILKWFIRDGQSRRDFVRSLKVFVGNCYASPSRANNLCTNEDFKNDAFEYIYHCLSFSPFSGMKVFTKLLCLDKGWILPATDEILSLIQRNDLDVICMYGAEDWISPWYIGDMIFMENDRPCRARKLLYVLQEAGHFPYCEQVDQVNDIFLYDISPHPTPIRNAAELERLVGPKVNGKWVIS